MARNIKALKVFIASPGGLENERKAFREVIQAYNESDAIARDVLFQPVGWEDTLGGIGRPQTIINENIRDSDYFILLLWDRWGSQPDADASCYTSGTHEEYHIAMECCCSEKLPMRKLVLMFKSVDPKQLSDPGQQLQKVLEFRKEIENRKTHFFHSFDTTENFKEWLRKHLAAWLRDEEEGGMQLKENQEDVVPSIDDSDITPKEQLAMSPDRSLIEKAWALADDGRLTEAEVEFSKLTVGQSQPEPIIEFGRFLLRIGRLDQAIAMFEEAARFAEDKKEPDAVSIAYRNLGNAHYKKDNIDKAEQMYLKALEIAEKIGQLDCVARNYGNIGIVLKTRGDLDGAEQMYRKVLEIAEKEGLLDVASCAYGNLGIVLKTRGDLDGGELMYRKALEIAQRIGRQEHIISNYGNLGNTLYDKGDLAGAEQMYRKALEIAQRIGQLDSIASQYGNIGIVLKTRGDLDGAEQMYRKAHDVAERLGLPQMIEWAKFLLASLHRQSPESGNKK